MRLKNIRLTYIAGERMYCQGIKGKRNYQHRKGSSVYNGYGGCEEFFSSALILAGIDEEGCCHEIDIKAQVLDYYGRKRLGEKFVSMLRNQLPESVEVNDGMLDMGFLQNTL